MELTSQRRKELEDLQKSLKIKFIHLELLNQALTHSSYAKSFNKKDISYNENIYLRNILISMKESYPNFGV